MAYRIEKEEGIIQFTIDRPAVRNAVNHEIMEGLQKVIAMAKQDATTRFLVITGEGDQSFCSGGDLSVFHALTTEDEAFDMLNKMATILYELMILPIPTIALINGAAVGGGCEIATACDYRLVANHANCGFIQGSLAITSGWGGGTYLFERGLSHDQVLKMLMEASPLNAIDLKEMGWGTVVFEGDKQIALATFLHKMSGIHPTVHRAYKSMAIRKWEQTNLFERVQAEVRQCAKLWESDAHHEAVQNFLSKSKTK